MTTAKLDHGPMTADETLATVCAQIHNAPVIEKPFAHIVVAFIADTSMRFQRGGVARNRALYALAKKIHAALPTRKWHGLDKLGAGVGGLLLHGTSRIPASTYEELICVYRNDVLTLQTLIDRDLSAWLSVSAYS